MASDWGVPPWEIEEKCTQEYYSWWLSIRAERVALENEKANQIARRNLGNGR